MYKAVRKLMQPGLPIKQLTSEIGYDDPAQLSRTFKHSMGLSPQEYRAGTAGYLVPPADQSAPFSDSSASITIARGQMAHAWGATSGRSQKTMEEPRETAASAFAGNRPDRSPGPASPGA